MSRALQTIMSDRGITQTQIADVLGRSQNYVSGRLIGRHPLSNDIIIAVAHLARLTPRALMVEIAERMGQESDPGTAPLPYQDRPSDLN